MSGLLVEDQNVITTAAQGAGFKFDHLQEHNGWIGILFSKNE
jgi:hypothetical protein